MPDSEQSQENFYWLKIAAGRVLPAEIFGPQEFLSEVTVPRSTYRLIEAFDNFSKSI